MIRGEKQHHLREAPGRPETPERNLRLMAREQLGFRQPDFFSLIDTACASNFAIDFCWPIAAFKT